MIGVTVTLFGPARDMAGVDQFGLELPDGATVNDLSAALGERCPVLSGSLPAIRFAVNASFARSDQVLADGDVVAVIPPVSGGSGEACPDLILLSDAPLDPELVRRHLLGGADAIEGGVCVFEGRTRLERHGEHGPLVALAYEAYDELAVKQMGDLAKRARTQWPLGAVVILHRVGRVAIGEPSVIIGVSSGHRSEAFAACRWLIDTLKQEVPIWKKEIWESDESSWVDPTQVVR